ncbi:MAG: hypothetical protein ACTSSJ_07860 [Candidatus Odinarchaeia archaeon]
MPTKYFIEIYDRIGFLKSLEGAEIRDETFYNEILNLSKLCNRCTKYVFHDRIEVKSKNLFNFRHTKKDQGLLRNKKN